MMIYTRVNNLVLLASSVGPTVVDKSPEKFSSANNSIVQDK